MKKILTLFICSFCFTFQWIIASSNNFDKIVENKNSDWKELLGKWQISNQLISPKFSNGTDSQFVLCKEDMSIDTRWSRMKVKFRFEDEISSSAGFVLNTQDSKEFGFLRINHTNTSSTLQAGRWEYGKYRTQLSVNIKQSLAPGKWYCLEVLPTTGRKEWRPWTIVLTDCETNEIISNLGIENSFSLFGRGVTGIYAKGKISFNDYHIDIINPSTKKGQLQLAPLFTNGLVMQQKMYVPVWGLAKPADKVKVIFNHRTFTTTANNAGHWKVYIPPMTATDSLNMLVIASNDSIWVKNIAVGEVWIASGQSNMQMKVWQSDLNILLNNLSVNKSIRMFIQPQWPSEKPVFDSGGHWEFSSPSTTSDWSAVAYSFALRLQNELHVPVGIICSYWGGTAAESWLPREELKNNAITKPILEQYNEAKVALKTGNLTYGINPWNIPGQSHAPGYLFNGMIYPHIPYAIKGVIWYQGESNANRAKQYEVLFPMLINSWRKAWQLPDLFFLYVQLAGYDGKASGSNISSAWPQLRDAQRKTLQKLYHVGMAVTLDIGDSTNIHPIHKKEVGERLARWALHDAYHFLDIVRSGPLFKSVKFKDQVAIVDFTETASGLKVRDGNILRGFTVAGADQKFFPAHAEVNADKKSISIWSENIKHPVAVRYAWENYPSQANLINSENLPASSFRTDSWSLSTDTNR